MTPATTPMKSTPVARPRKLESINTTTDVEDKVLGWLAEQVTRAQKKPFGEVFTITPDMARVLLTLNPSNRKISPLNVGRIAHDIRTDKWRLNGEPIIFSRDGELNDGQHRLHAVIEADRPVETFITFGLDRESRTTVDTGIARTAASFLSMNAEPYYTNAAAVAALLYSWRVNNQDLEPHSDQRATKQDTLDTYEHYRAEIQAACAAVVTRKGYSNYGGAVLVLAYLLFSRANKSEADQFLQKLVTGESLDAYHPILTLRNRFINDIKLHKRSYNARMELLVRTWNMVRRGQKTARTIPVMGEIPEIL